MHQLSYREHLKDPRWQKKRLSILARDDWKCRGCGDSNSTLNVHHKFYLNGVMPWEYKDAVLVTLCENCHRLEHEIKNKAAGALLHMLLSKGLLYADMIALADNLSRMTNQEVEARLDFSRGAAS